MNVKENAPEWATHYQVFKGMIIYESLTHFTRLIDGKFDGVTKKIMAHIKDDAKEL